jgi:membrane protein
MAGATAFFTTFALPSILMLVFQFLSILFQRKIVREQLFGTLSQTLGRSSTLQIIEVIRQFRNLAHNWYLIAGGFLFLLFVATTLFSVMKSSINQIWSIKLVKKRRFLEALQDRSRSLAIILLASILFAFGLITEGVQTFLSDYIRQVSPMLTSYFNSFLNYLLSLFIVSIWFSFLFGYLPDGRPTYQIALIGGGITGILFLIGKVMLHWLLSYSNINTIYGASGSIVLLLLFVFYSSFIIYYGAAFTLLLSKYRNQHIKPRSYAAHYQIKED